MSGWVQIFAIAPDGNGYQDAQMAKRIDDHISQNFPAAFVAPDGVPVKNNAGEYEIRCFTEAMCPIVSRVLTEHYGLKITRKKSHAT